MPGSIPKIIIPAAFCFLPFIVPQNSYFVKPCNDLTAVSCQAQKNFLKKLQKKCQCALDKGKKRGILSSQRAGSGSFRLLRAKAVLFTRHSQKICNRENVKWKWSCTKYCIFYVSTQLSWNCSGNSQQSWASGIRRLKISAVAASTAVPPQPNKLRKIAFFASDTPPIRGPWIRKTRF